MCAVSLLESREERYIKVMNNKERERGRERDREREPRRQNAQRDRDSDRKREGGRDRKRQKGEEKRKKKSTLSRHLFVSQRVCVGGGGGKEKAGKGCASVT